MEIKEFNKGLSLIGKTGAELQTTIHKCAMFALEKVNLGKTTGADSPIQRLWNTVAPLKSINQQAFMQWCQEFGCCRFVKLESTGTFVVKYKDRSKEPGFNEEQAIALADASPFWEFAKDPEPNVKPYNVLGALRNILTQAKSAATGGAKGDKPIRVIEGAEFLEAIKALVSDPFSLQKLGIDSAIPAPAIQQPEQIFTEEDQAELAELIHRQPMQLAA